jgi:hypothetical protein
VRVTDPAVHRHAVALEAGSVAIEREPEILQEARDDEYLGALVSRLPEEKEE